MGIFGGFHKWGYPKIDGLWMEKTHLVARSEKPDVSVTWHPSRLGNSGCRQVGLLVNNQIAGRREPQIVVHFGQEMIAFLGYSKWSIAKSLALSIRIGTTPRTTINYSQYVIHCNTLLHFETHPVALVPLRSSIMSICSFIVPKVTSRTSPA